MAGEPKAEEGSGAEVAPAAPAPFAAAPPPSLALSPHARITSRRRFRGKARGAR
jgi:hypothetical protein